MQLPDGFLKLIAGYGNPVFDRLPEALATESPVSIRYNRRKHTLLHLPKEYSGNETVPWCETGMYLNERPQFTLDPAFHQGLYYVQDASSMFIRHILRHLTGDGDPVRYLDACAAPGGKTTAALDVLPEGSVVVANEYVASRAAVLRENLIKWGAPFHVVTQGDTSRFAAIGRQFDIIAADVPCSGEGMMRKDPKAVEQWSTALIKQCVSRQREIIDNLWNALVPGGYLIYSTCTFNRDENELMAEYMRQHFGAESVDIPIDDSWGIVPAVSSEMHCYRFIPGCVRGEGLFMTVVRKPDGEMPSGLHGDNRRANKSNVSGKTLKKTKQKTAVKIPEEIKLWLKLPEDSEFLAGDDGTIYAIIPTVWRDFPFTPRLETGTIKGRDIIPSHALAMSTLLNTAAFPTAEIDRDTALEYLRCQAISPPAGTPRGFVLLTHNCSPLGWAKNIGQRANNLYPKSWRILKRE